MYNKELYEEDVNKKEEIIKKYFISIGDSYFIDALKKFSIPRGFGIETVCCTFASDYDVWDEGYFGDTGVEFSIQNPAVSQDVFAIVNYMTFYKYLIEASDNYLLRHQEDKDNVESYLLKIKDKINVNRDEL